MKEWQVGKHAAGRATEEVAAVPVSARPRRADLREQELPRRRRDIRLSRQAEEAAARRKAARRAQEAALAAAQIQKLAEDLDAPVAVRRRRTARIAQEAAAARAAQSASVTQPTSERARPSVPEAVSPKRDTTAVVAALTTGLAEVAQTEVAQTIEAAEAADTAINTLESSGVAADDRGDSAAGHDEVAPRRISRAERRRQERLQAAGAQKADDAIRNDGTDSDECTTEQPATASASRDSAVVDEQQVIARETSSEPGEAADARLDAAAAPIDVVTELIGSSDARAEQREDTDTLALGESGQSETAAAQVHDDQVLATSDAEMAESGEASPDLTELDQSADSHLEVDDAWLESGGSHFEAEAPRIAREVGAEPAEFEADAVPVDDDAPADGAPVYPTEIEATEVLSRSELTSVVGEGVRLSRVERRRRERGAQPAVPVVLVSPTRKRPSRNRMLQGVVVGTLAVTGIALPVMGFGTSGGPAAQAVQAYTNSLVGGSTAQATTPRALTGSDTAAARSATNSASEQARSNAASSACVAEGAQGVRAAFVDSSNYIVMPLENGVYRLSSAFGYRVDPIYGDYSLHAGQDMAAPLNTPIFAIADGTVTHAGKGIEGRSNNLIIIKHEINGEIFYSWYVHMYDDGVHVKEGDRVTAGQQIGKVGSNGNSTGPHLHLEIHDADDELRDPLEFLSEHGAVYISELCD
ncbi:M23 family metallopeptidase [Actinobaculum sp. 352]|uniref:M23 family metallopeptidase n=1 Tax=Actinobaculum sp. 352 TaxID=2490946 RepID=UPI000F7D5AAF|nr:M23 family metallopeptidase [Actinobaculum sp. 352]RTE49012.1 M23 family metallopeptidase [Actinobaculum sp. 352]